MCIFMVDNKNWPPRGILCWVRDASSLFMTSSAWEVFFLNFYKEVVFHFMNTAIYQLWNQGIGGKKVGCPISSMLSIFRSTLFAYYRVIIMQPKSLLSNIPLLNFHNDIPRHKELLNYLILQEFMLWILHDWQIGWWRFLQEILLLNYKAFSVSQNWNITFCRN